MSVCLKIEGEYVVRFSERTITTGPKPDTAMVWPDAETALEMLPSIRGYKYTFVNAERLMARVKWPWIIRALPFPYVAKRGPNLLYLTDDEESAKRFPTKEAAEKYIRELSAKYTGSFRAVRREVK